jgi:hypothetical protein
MNNFHQSIEDILKAATPEQKIFWNDIFLRFGERCAIRQFVYTGIILGSAIATYVARQMFFGYQLNINGQNGGTSVSPGSITFFDENNVLNGQASNNVMAWNATTAVMNYTVNSAQINNILFSRAGGNGIWTHINFIGYRFTY